MKCVAKTKKVTFRKPLKVTYINWLRELDLNQRPSGYECASKVLLIFMFFNNINRFELFLIKIKLYKTTQILHKKIIAAERCPAYIQAVQEFLIMYLFEELSLIFPALLNIPV